MKKHMTLLCALMASGTMGAMQRAQQQDAMHHDAMHEEEVKGDELTAWTLLRTAQEAQKKAAHAAAETDDTSGAEAPSGATITGAVSESVAAVTASPAVATGALSAGVSKHIMPKVYLQPKQTRGVVHNRHWDAEYMARQGILRRADVERGLCVFAVLAWLALVLYIMPSQHGNK